jgi:hypothetical protein
LSIEISKPAIATGFDGANLHCADSTSRCSALISSAARSPITTPGTIAFPVVVVLMARTLSAVDMQHLAGDEWRRLEVERTVDDVGNGAYPVLRVHLGIGSGGI